MMGSETLEERIVERKELEVYSEASNYAIVRMPGRNFPGCVVQGDSLNGLLSLAKSIRQRVDSSDDEELIGETDELVELISDRLSHYESVLSEHGISLPYNRV
jgi:hypothetical protein